MEQFLFRAWYKPDIKRGIPLLFEQKEIDGELYFYHEDGHPEAPLQYHFETPFIDNDWIVEMAISDEVDVNEKRIFEGDIVVFPDDELCWKMDYIEYEVIMYNGCFMLLNKKTGERFLFLDLKSKIKVIGTIHDVKKKRKSKK